MFDCFKNHQHPSTLNKGTDEELACVGYHKHLWRQVLYVGLSLVTFGAVWLVCLWLPHWKVKLTCVRCSLKKADVVVLTDESNRIFVEEVHCEVIGQAKGLKREYSTFKLKENVAQDAMDESGGGDYFFNESRRTRQSAILDSEKCVVRYFEHHHTRYAWNEASSSFEMLRGLSKDTSCRALTEAFEGFNNATRINRLTLYGFNQLVIEVRSYCQLLFQEVLNPFYIFQIFSITLWSFDDYYIYAACIFIISAVSLIVELIETRKQQISLRDTVMTDDVTVTVYLPGGQETCEIPSSMLVPGDLIQVPNHSTVMPCDAVLLSGCAVVDEGMLTGESVPVTKFHVTEELSSEIYSPIAHKKNTIFCGTKVLQTRFYGNAKVKAVVVRTGYSTMKGELVRMILYPKPIKFSFYSDALKFVLFLATLAFLGLVYIFTFLTIFQFDVKDRIIRSLDIVTVAVPPALPAALTIGIIYAQSRLKKLQIFCISPQRINLCGLINRMCFDKTGTLTEDGLDLWGVVEVKQEPDGEAEFGEPIIDPKKMSRDNKVVIAMATCHSLIMIGGETCGDPLDLKMFEWVNWLLEEPGSGSTQYDTLVPTIVKPITAEAYMLDDAQQDHTPTEVAILRQFPFDSALQRMSVIVRMTSLDHMTCFVKGSPEKIVSICIPTSVPKDFQEVLKQYTGTGHRVVALSTKDLEKSVSWHHVQRLPRNSIESDLTFLGLLVTENKLKPESTPVLKHLSEANIGTVMITGDNILTALCVARQCHIVKPGAKVVQVDAMPPENGKRARINWQLSEEMEMGKLPSHQVHPFIRVDSKSEASEEISLDISESCDLSNYQFAITGRSYSVVCQYFPDLLPRILAKGAVFARMTPDQKTSIIENLQKLGFTVGMCGDGANDCGALRTSHAGISLSQMEASVAAPFTSKVNNISCVPIIIKEGRASLVTSFAVFKFMALYSIIQYSSVIILITKFTRLSDPMYLFIDLAIITSLALTIGRTEPSSILSSKRPHSRLASSSSLIGVVLHVVVVVVFQLLVLFFTMHQPWYVGHRGRRTELTFDTTSIFYISIFQYLIVAFTFAKGPPYRKRIWTNYWFLGILIVLTIACTSIVISPWDMSYHIFGVKKLPDLIFKLVLIIAAFVNLAIAFLLEELLMGSKTYRSMCNKITCTTKRKPLYKEIARELNQCTDWPPVAQVTWSDPTVDQRRDSS